MNAYEHAYDSLERLGQTAEEVAKSLAARGIKRKKGRLSEFCPLACFLQSKGYAGALVGLSHFVVHPDQRGRCLPIGAYRFRVRFDMGRFPELEG